MVFASEQVEAGPTWILPAFPVLWLAIGGLLSALGGWLTLAGRYRDRGRSREVVDRYSMRSMQLRLVPLFPVKYGGCVGIQITDAGIRLAGLFLFRFLHPPLLIPWAEIEDADEDSFLGFRWVTFTLRGGRPAIRLYGAPAAAVADAWRSRRYVRAPAA